MPVIENLCPKCGYQPNAEPPAPDAGPDRAGVLTCPRCGFLGIWDVHYWREPTDAERTALLAVGSVSDAAFSHLWMSMCQDSDIERAYHIMVDRLAPFLHTAGLSVAEGAILLRHLATELSRAGFHTHHEPITLKEDL